MKHKLLTFALMGAMVSTMLFSCKNAEEPIQSPGDNNSGDMVEYSISVNIPEEVRTRADNKFDSSGLLMIEREITDLTYVVYENNMVKEVNSVTRDDTNPFEVVFRITPGIDPSEVNLFFWAGGKNEISSTIKDNTPFVLDERAFSVSLNLSVSNSFYNNSNLYDSFAGFYSLEELITDKSRKAYIALKRPFAQIHIISDDLIPSETNLFRDFSEIVSVKSGLFREPGTSMALPTTWRYSNDTFSFNFNVSNWFDNKLNEGEYRTTFKEREMEYLSCFLIFAPKVKAQYINPSNQDILNKLNFIVCNNDNHKDTNYYDLVTVTLPEEGLEANTRYVIYNKKRSEGGTGFINDPYYVISVDNDVNWNDPDTQQESDRL